MDNFTVYPAIDLRQGRVVRLSQGDPDRETRYANQPLRVAQQWQGAGATWLHVVNLDGAFGEQGMENIAALADITTTDLRVQFGGGMRSIGLSWAPSQSTIPRSSRKRWLNLVRIVLLWA